jgi:hypothetical protein
MCRLSIYCDLSTQLAGGVQAILQAVCLSSPLPNSTPVLQGALCPSSLMRCKGSFPCMPIPHRSRMSWCKKIAPATPSITSVIFVGPHVRVGYYAPAARTTLNPCVFLSSSFIYQQAKRLSPLFILGFRAGALHHPAGEFPLRQCHSQISEHIIPWRTHTVPCILFGETNS